MSDNLIPDKFVQNLWDGLVKDMRSYHDATFGPEEYQRKGHVETTESPAEWIAAREEFARTFNALVEDGIEKGFLGRDHCYECSGELGVTEHTSKTEWVYDETKAEWEARVADLPEITLLHGHKIGGTRDRTQ